MAYELGMDSISLPANGDLSTNKEFFVKVANNSGAGEVAVAGAGERVLGVLKNEPDAQGKVAEVASKRGAITKVSAGGTITAGNEVTPDASGEAVVAGSGDVVAGVALNSAVDGDIVEIQLV
jgi:hypothetical protein